MSGVPLLVPQKMARKTVVSAAKRARKVKKSKPLSESDRVHVITPDASDTEEKIMEGEMVTDETEVVEGEPRVWLPGMELGEDEVLEPDMSVYVMLQEMQTEWPCLSFDALHSGTGREMLDFPMEATLVAGTQADRPEKNKIFLMKWTNLRKNQTKDDNDSDSDSDNDNDSSDNESDSDSENENENENESGKAYVPRCHIRSIAHAEGAGINRIRALQSNDASKLVVSTWSERGRVYLWDLSGVRAELEGYVAADPMRRPSRLFGNDAIHLKPLAVLPMRTEGFALDWSRREWGALLAGDCSGAISHIQLAADGTAAAVNGRPFLGHSASVEDLQWSPSESTVFASASCDQTVRIWDVRCDPRKPALSAHCHESDVNVISWNRNVSYLLASGADDGSFKTWDLRAFAATASSLESTLSTPVATFKWHLSAITSIEWHPTESSVLAASGADDQISLWDFAVEQDREAMGVGHEDLPLAPNGMPIPPHLLFVHQGQREVKEIHWHPQSPGVLMSTAGSGFNIFKTISI